MNIKVNDKVKAIKDMPFRGVVKGDIGIVKKITTIDTELYVTVETEIIVIAESHLSDWMKI